MNFPNPKTPAESVVVEFDFSAELDTITSATMSIRAIGTDPLASSVLVGAHQLNGASVLQRVGGGVNRVDYEIICIATYGSDVRELAGTLRVRSAA